MDSSSFLRRVGSGLLVLAAVGGGCAQVIGIDHDYRDGDDLGAGGSMGSSSSSSTGSSTSSASGSSSSGSTGGCPAGYECLPDGAVDTYVIMGEGAGSCPAGWSAGDKVTDGNDPGCSACTCGSPSPGTCAPGKVERWSDGVCGSSVIDTFFPTSGSCTAVVSHANGYETHGSTIQGAGCAPSTSDPLPITEYPTCEFPLAGAQACDGGGRCVPTGGVQSNNICMLISSVDNCPSGFAEVATVYTEYTDKRDCTCDCGPGGKCQGGEILLYSSGDCTGDSMLSVPAATSCEDTSDLGAESSFKANGGSWVSGPCMPLLDEDGEIDLKGKKKVCCLL